MEAERKEQGPRWHWPQWATYLKVPLSPQHLAPLPCHHHSLSPASLLPPRSPGKAPRIRPGPGLPLSPLPGHIFCLNLLLARHTPDSFHKCLGARPDSLEAFKNENSILNVSMILYGTEQNYLNNEISPHHFVTLPYKSRYFCAPSDARTWGIL